MDLYCDRLDDLYRFGKGLGAVKSKRILANQSGALAQRDLRQGSVSTGESQPTWILGTLTQWMGTLVVGGILGARRRFCCSPTWERDDRGVATPFLTIHAQQRTEGVN